MTQLAPASAEQDQGLPLDPTQFGPALQPPHLDHMHRLATLGTLAASLAHEINNLLTPVQAYAQLAKANSHDAALQTKALDRAILGVEAVSRLVEAVLGFSQAHDPAEDANISDVVQASLACLARDPDKDGIKLHIAIAPDARVRIRPLALQQVILNLILNAQAAMHGKPGELRITAKHCPHSRTRISISDTGPGIRPSLAPTIFQPFVTGQSRRPGAAPSSKPTGTGLGLAMCKRLVEHAGGSISAESTPGRGATFTVTLPTSEASPNLAGPASIQSRSPQIAA